VFRIGQDQGLSGLGLEDLSGQLEQVLGRSRSRTRRGARGEADRLAGVRVEHEERLSDLGRPVLGITTMEPHVALAEAAHAMGIDSQQSALKVA
jgi:hypothetical protein